MTLLDFHDDMLLRILVFFLNVPTRETIDDGDFDARDDMGAPIVWKLVCTKMNALLPGHVRTQLLTMLYTRKLFDFAREVGGLVTVTANEQEYTDFYIDKSLIRTVMSCDAARLFVELITEAPEWLEDTGLFDRRCDDLSVAACGSQCSQMLELVLAMGFKITAEGIYKASRWGGREVVMLIDKLGMAKGRGVTKYRHQMYDRYDGEFLQTVKINLNKKLPSFEEMALWQHRGLQDRREWMPFQEQWLIHHYRTHQD